MLKRWLELAEGETALKRAVREQDVALDKLAYDKYPNLAEAEIKTMVIDDKWMTRVSAAVQDELDRVSQTLTGRIRELAERYATPMPQLTEEVVDTRRASRGTSRTDGSVMEVKPGYKLTDVGIIPDEWKCAPIASVARLESGHTPSKKKPSYWGGAVQWISLHDTAALDGREIATTAKTITQDGLNHSSARLLPPGTVVFSRTATVGKSTVMATSMSTSQDFANYICGPDLDNHYLVYLFRGMGRTWQRLMAGSIHNTIYMPVFKALTIALPPLAEQRAIASALSDIDVLLNGLDGLIAKKRDLKQAAMQKLLTGQMRLPGFKGKWEVKTVAELERHKLLKLSRGRVISKKDIANAPGDFPIYSSSIHNDGLFGRYGDYMFDEELITWSVDGGGNFFYRRKHKFSVTNVCGFLRVETSRIDYRFLAAELQLLHSRKKFDYQSKAHPSVVRKEYEVRECLKSCVLSHTLPKEREYGDQERDFRRVAEG